jgi:hypothetical protein
MHSLPTLRTWFLHTALRHGLADLDAGTLRLSAPRAVTREVASRLYDLPVEPFGRLDGIAFDSRHGDGLIMWAIFERPGPDDHPVSGRVGDIKELDLTPDHPQLRAAFKILGLTWHRPPP